MKKMISVRELVESLHESYHVLGSLDRYVSRPSPIDQAGEKSLSFYAREKEQALQAIRGSKAEVIVCPDGIEFCEQDYESKTLIQVSDPRLSFVRLLQRHYEVGVEFGIHPSAIIDDKAKIDPHVYIGPHCYIGQCEIGEGTAIYGNVHIYPKVKIGKRVTIHAGTVVGVPGFSYVRNEKDELERFPQLGGVVIEDDVELDSNTSIECGAMNNTIIGKGTKMGNLVLIGHNSQIGKHCVIVDQAFLAGSVKVGNYTWIGPHACIKEWISIGSNVLVGMGSVVTKNIGDNVVVMGVPAKELGKNIP